MKTPFVLSMAWRESRASRRRLTLYMGAISLGIAALVSINSFRANVAAAIRAESRALLGADLELRSSARFSDSVVGLLDSLSNHETPVSYATYLASMALATRTDQARLVEVRAVRGTYPYYGSIDTEPPNLWTSFRQGSALVDPSLLIQLDVAIGDTLAIGNTTFEIAGSLSHVPGDIGFRAAFGPRVYISAAALEDTGLLQFGSRAGYRAYLKFTDDNSLNLFLARHRASLENQRVNLSTAGEREQNLTDSLDALARFLGLVGLVALLLGGIGVASAVHVFVTNKLETVAVLRCLGARQRTVFAIYLLQALVLGALGALAGVFIGLAVQRSLPSVLDEFLPIEVHVTLEWPVLAAGFLGGVWVAAAFALLPLLRVRGVSPLRALRTEFEEQRARHTTRGGVQLIIAVSIIAISLWQAPNWETGAMFAVAMTATAGVLWLFGWVLRWLMKRFIPRSAAYVVRQGVANLYRPQNQTVAVTLAIGFGVFLLTSLSVVQRNLLDQIDLERQPNQPNLVMFDIQTDQRDSVRSLVADQGLDVLISTPIVPARIARINDSALTALRENSRRPRWALTRQYRNTYRDTTISSEMLVAGTWWGDAAADSTPALPRISLERGLADELQVAVGDQITWDVQGIEMGTVIANLRTVEWARLEPNFFVVFEPGILENAPQTHVMLTRAGTATQRAQLQRDIVLAFPNVAVVDITEIRATIDRIVGSVAFAIRFMALFSIVSGVIVLIGAIATSRFQRMRESVLLKTLGARHRQIRQILLTEYATLGILAGLTGSTLGGVAGWVMVTRAFELPFRTPVVSLAMLWLGSAVLTAVIGLLNSRDILRRPPLAIIRELGQ